MGQFACSQSHKLASHAVSIELRAHLKGYDNIGLQVLISFFRPLQFLKLEVFLLVVLQEPEVDQSYQPVWQVFGHGGSEQIPLQHSDEEVAGQDVNHHSDSLDFHRDVE